MFGTSFADPTASFVQFSSQLSGIVTDDRCLEKGSGQSAELPCRNVKQFIRVCGVRGYFQIGTREVKHGAHT